MFNCFCKLLVCHDFGLIFLPRHGFVLFPEEKNPYIKKKLMSMSIGSCSSPSIICVAMPSCLLLLFRLMMLNTLFEV